MCKATCANTVTMHECIIAIYEIYDMNINQNHMNTMQCKYMCNANKSMKRKIQLNRNI